MVQVENKRPGKLRLKYGVTLHPGFNEVPRAAWEKCRDDAITKHYISRLEVRVVPGSPMPKPPEVPTEAPQDGESGASQPEMFVEEEVSKESEALDLSALKAKKAVKVVESLDHQDQLYVLLTSETRPSVVAAIEKRIGELEI